METKTKRKQGFHEDVDPLLGKARKHSIVAQKNKIAKEHISKEIAITPAYDELEETLTLHFKDSDKFVDTVLNSRKSMILLYRSISKRIVLLYRFQKKWWISFGIL